MKPYFAKFIPVQGEINDGDFYSFQGVIQQCKKSIIPALKEMYGENWKSNWYQKVKLFLCSRYIQVGDKYLEHTQVNPDRYQEFIADHDSYFYEPNRIENSFRVLGEISPAVTWVKEGDEFDESQLLARPGGASIKRELSHWRNNPFGKDYLGVNCEIFVKCPCCGHFH